MANASSRVRQLFVSKSQPLTLPLIKQELPDLKPSEVSMALCYLVRMRYLTRQQIANDKRIGRKTIWEYTYHADRLPKEQA